MWVSKIMGLPPVIILVISDSRKVAKLCYDCFFWKGFE